MSSLPRLDVVLPVHNEAGSIERVVIELIRELDGLVTPRLLICEDGSTDGTREILHTLEQRFPLVLVSEPERRGYSAAVLAGLREAQTPFVLVLDADGQCDPGDIKAFLHEHERWDVTMGWRNPRSEGAVRRLASASFGLVHRALFNVPVHDPSCPYTLLRAAAIEPLLDQLGTLEFGFWWEIVARAHRLGLSIREVRVHHRDRLAGGSRAFPLRKVPYLAVTHLAGLLRVRLDRSPP